LRLPIKQLGTADYLVKRVTYVLDCSLQGIALTSVVGLDAHYHGLALYTVNQKNVAVYF